MATAIAILADKVNQRAGEVTSQISTEVGKINSVAAGKVVAFNDKISADSGSLASTMATTAADVSSDLAAMTGSYVDSIGALISNPGGVRDSLSEIRAELAADKDKFSNLIATSSKLAKDARDAELTRFGSTAEFVLSVDSNYTPVSRF